MKIRWPEEVDAIDLALFVLAVILALSCGPCRMHATYSSKPIAASQQEDAAHATD